MEGTNLGWQTHFRKRKSSIESVSQNSLFGGCCIESPKGQLFLLLMQADSLERTNACPSYSG